MISTHNVYFTVKTQHKRSLFIAYAPSAPFADNSHGFTLIHCGQHSQTTFNAIKHKHRSAFQLSQVFYALTFEFSNKLAINLLESRTAVELIQPVFKGKVIAFGLSWCRTLKCIYQLSLCYFAQAFINTLFSFVQNA